MSCEQFEDYHLVWLEAHPTRSAEWLRARLRDGFHIHHVDGDHSNNAHTNLVLIEEEDHLRLHGRNLKCGLTSFREAKMAKSAELGRRAYEMRQLGVFWGDVAQRLLGDYNASSTVMQRARDHATRNAMQWPINVGYLGHSCVSLRAQKGAAAA